MINLYEEKVKRMTDDELHQECILFIRALEQTPITPDNKFRMTTLFNAAVERPALQQNKEDFLTVLKVLKYL